jgi:phi13 family phage major tail protein
VANKITFGLRNVHIALRDEDDSNGDPVWGTPEAVPGAIGFAPTPEGEEFTLYADDTIYFSATRNTGYTAELEMALIPDDLLAEILNWEIDDNGALVEDADALPAPFALLGQVDGDAAQRRFVYYECRASRPSREERTKEATLSPSNDVLNLTISPVEIDEKLLVRAVMEKVDDGDGANSNEEGDGAYDTFFDEVYIPTFTPEA